MILLQTSDADPPSAAAIVGGIIVCLVFICMALISQRKFRDGSAYIRLGRTNPTLADVLVRMAFMIVPAIWTLGFAAIFLLLVGLFIATDINFFGVLAVGCALAMAVGFAWALKEYFSPSERRRPDWWGQYKAD